MEIVINSNKCMPKKIKILWFSNYRFSDSPIRATGTWLKVIGEMLSATKDVDFFNVTDGNTSSIKYEKLNNINQYIIPVSNKLNNSLPSKKIIKGIENIINELNPDIIHVWGTENYWGQFTSISKFNGKVLLEIQGLTTQITTQFYGGLTPLEILKSTGIKEFIKLKSHLFFRKMNFYSKSIKEAEVIKKHHYISVQSDWSKNTVLQINKNAIIFESLRPLRNDFVVNAGSWEYNNNNIVFFSASSIDSFKGLHVLVRALGLLKSNSIKFKLRIAGHHGSGIRQSGYELYIKRLINKMGVREDVLWLGPLNEKEIVTELKFASACVIPSFIESYCLALYEAVCIGTPVVCSYAGALPEVEKITDNVCFFQPGDYYTCAKLISDYFDNNTKISYRNGLFVSPKESLNRQLNIYNAILSEE